jgi:ATP-dependent Clp protease protease subunit
MDLERPEDHFAEQARAMLLERRTILVTGVLDSALAGRAAAELMMLDASGDGAIELRLDSAEGTLDAAFTLIDTIDLCGVDIHITVAGRAEGPAVGVLAVGHLRRATEHARLRLRDPSIEISGSATTLAELARSEMERLDRFHERLAAATHRPIEDIKVDSNAGLYLSAAEAITYGLLDELVRRPGTIHEFPGRRLGFRP